MKFLISLILLLATSAQAAPMLSSNPFAPIIYINCTSYPWAAPADVIDRVVAMVAGAYSPFNVRVTKDFPGYLPNVAQVVMGGPLQAGGIAGQSVIGNWTIGTQYDQFATAFAAKVYADGLGNDPTLCGIAAIHELGHNIGLYHQIDGFMEAILNPDPLQYHWSIGINSIGVPQDDVAFLGGQFGFAPVAEPHLLLLVPLAFARRERRR